MEGEDVSEWFVGDVGQLLVWEEIALRSPDVACISAPCQSLTTTGNRKGWNHELGTVLANSISCAAVAGIPILAYQALSPEYPLFKGPFHSWCTVPSRFKV